VLDLFLVAQGEVCIASNGVIASSISS
jgi:hypothetical protein